MDPWNVAAFVLLAVAVGAALPALIQLYITLRSLHRTLDRLERRLEPVLRSTDDAARSLRTIGASLERHTDDLATVIAGAADLAEVARELRGSLKTAAVVGGALGPILAAAIRAWTERRDEAGGRPGDGTDSRNDPEAERARGEAEPGNRTEPRRAVSG